jgi:hypothetical protein
MKVIFAFTKRTIKARLIKGCLNQGGGALKILAIHCEGKFNAMIYFQSFPRG